MARELGMSLDEVVEKHTVRQMKLWEEYLDEEPTDAMWYLMQMTAEVRLANQGNRDSVSVDQFRIRRERSKPTVVDDRTVDEFSRDTADAWIEALGGNCLVVRVPREELTDE